MKYRLIGLLLFCVTLVLFSCTKSEEKPRIEETAADFRYADTRMLFPFPEDANRVLERLYVTDGKIGLVYQPLAAEEKSPGDEKTEWTVDSDTGEVIKNPTDIRKCGHWKRFCGSLTRKRGQLLP